MHDPLGVIPGISTYCDRWCERCAYTMRCQLFAVERARVEWQRQGGDFESFWQQWFHAFDQPKQWVGLGWSESQDDVDLSADDEDERDDGHFDDEDDDNDLMAAVDDEDFRRRRNKADPLAVLGHDYAMDCHDWFKKYGILEHPDAEEPDGADGGPMVKHVDPSADVGRVREAVEIVLWHKFQVYVKLMRALHGEHDDWDGDPEMAGIPRDCDGSAKVSLIGVDRSIAAWAFLRHAVADEPARQVMLDFLLRLNRLRKGIERRFPQARSFVRPGFDTNAPDEPYTLPEHECGEDDEPWDEEEGF